MDKPAAILRTAPAERHGDGVAGVTAPTRRGTWLNAERIGQQPHVVPHRPVADWALTVAHVETP